MGWWVTAMAATAMAAALLVAACSGDTAVGRDDRQPAGWVECRNDTLGYTIAYPGDWYVAPDPGDDPLRVAPPGLFECQIFDPTLIEIQLNSEAPSGAMMVWRAGRFEDIRDTLFETEDLRTVEVTFVEATVVNGREAIRHETVTKSSDLGPAGIRHYGYVINRDELAFQVVTTNFPERLAAGYEQHKAVVDEAVATVRFD